jgi:hypothetical protein
MDVVYLRAGRIEEMPNRGSKANGVVCAMRVLWGGHAHMPGGGRGRPRYGGW